MFRYYFLLSYLSLTITWRASCALNCNTHNCFSDVTSEATTCTRLVLAINIGALALMMSLILFMTLFQYFWIIYNYLWWFMHGYLVFVQSSMNWVSGLTAVPFYPSALWDHGSLQSSASVCLSICLSVCLSVHTFSQHNVAKNDMLHNYAPWDGLEAYE